MIAKLWSLVAALAVVGSFVVAGATPPARPIRRHKQGRLCSRWSEKLPGSKVLDGRWGVERYAIAIPKGRDQGRVFVENSPRTRSRKVWSKQRLRVPGCAGDDVGLEIARRRGAICRMS